MVINNKQNTTREEAKLLACFVVGTRIMTLTLPSQYYIHLDGFTEGGERIERNDFSQNKKKPDK